MYRLYLLLLLLSASCTPTVPQKNTTPATDTITRLQADTLINTPAADTPGAEEATALYYIVIADTGSNYDQLHRLMLHTAQQLAIPIDTMGRGYDRKKNLICLPEDDKDEIYAGDYFPRRFPGTSLSIEYRNVYQEASGDKTMALVVGICTTIPEADSLLRLLRPVAPAAFSTAAKLYIGCMH